MTTKIIIFLAGLLLGPKAVMAIEEPEYELIAECEDYEVRRYAPYIVAETVVSADFDRAGAAAFRILAGYIFGNNRSIRPSVEIAAHSDTGVSEATGTSEKMAMTAPVFSAALEAAPTENYLYAFVMPAGYTLENLPLPLDSRVSIREVPGRTVAVRRYSGRWHEKGFLSNAAILRKALERDGLTALGAPMFARYNAPYVPWFMRRNEVMLEISPPLEQLQAESSDTR